MSTPCTVSFIFNPFKEIFLVIFNMEFPKQLQVFLFERLHGVMFLLVLNVSHHRIDL